MRSGTTKPTAPAKFKSVKEGVGGMVRGGLRKPSVLTIHRDIGRNKYSPRECVYTPKAERRTRHPEHEKRAKVRSDMQAGRRATWGWVWPDDRFEHDKARRLAVIRRIGALRGRRSRTEFRIGDSVFEIPVIMAEQIGFMLGLRALDPECMRAEIESATLKLIEWDMQRAQEATP